MRESCEKLELFDKGGDLASIKKRSLRKLGLSLPKILHSGRKCR